MLNQQTFVFDTPLYEKMSLNLKDQATFAQFFHGSSAKVDGHCIDCNRDSVFHSRGGYNGPKLPHISQIEGICSIDFVCQRNSDHFIKIFVDVEVLDTATKIADGFNVTKVGQIPSHADIAIAVIKRFTKILEQQDRSELVRAVGIASHGVNIGAFVYLRRVFERLIDRAAVRMGEALDTDLFKASRVHERITLISDFLPSFMVENARVYSVLSKGIHELDEETCGKFYELMLQSIQLMLEQEQEIKTRLESQSSLAKLIAGISL